ncbi:hypothetical protein GCM10010344_53020 [Streptomyces bluensis]|nr:hypothetical protein GCM10010344_53020 [Streptomyces bluensis]
MSRAITDVSPTQQTPSRHKALTCTYALTLDQRDTRGRFLRHVPRRAERGAEDEDRGVFRTVQAVLEGGRLRLTHRSTLASPRKSSVPGPPLSTPGSRTSPGDPHTSFT